MQLRNDLDIRIAYCNADYTSTRWHCKYARYQHKNNYKFWLIDWMHRITQNTDGFCTWSKFRWFH